MRRRSRSTLALVFSIVLPLLGFAAAVHVPLASAQTIVSAGVPVEAFVIKQTDTRPPETPIVGLDGGTAPLSVNGPNFAADLAVFASDPLNVEAGARLVLHAVATGMWGLLASLAVMALVYALRKFVPAHTVVGKWFASPPGAAVISVFMSMAFGCATLFLAKEPFTLAFVLKAVGIAIGASGTWSIGKAFKEWLGQRAAEKAGAEAVKDPGSTLDK